MPGRRASLVPRPPGLLRATGQPRLCGGQPQPDLAPSTVRSIQKWSYNRSRRENHSGDSPSRRCGDRAQAGSRDGDGLLVDVTAEDAEFHTEFEEMGTNGPLL